MNNRHDEVALEIAACIRSVSSMVYMKLQHNRGSPHEQMPDLEVSNFPLPGDHAFVEVTITNPLQRQVVQRAAQESLAAATLAEEKKMVKYSQLAKEQRRNLFIAAMEASGAFGRGLSMVLSHCEERVHQATFDESAHERTWASATFGQFWKQRIACAFWRGSLQMHLKNTRATNLGEMSPPSARADEELAQTSPTVLHGSSFFQPSQLF